MGLAEITTPARIFPEPAVGLPSPEAVRAQLERLRTQAFAGSAKLFAFLRFVVEEALEGRAARVKELVIGIELYGGVADYDPRIDSTGRVEARRLRRKLDAHYAGPGRHDAVIVSIPTGSYVPSFRLRQEGEGTVVDLPRAATRPMLAVLPFTALCVEEATFAAGVTDELIYAAERAGKVRVTPRAIMFQFRKTRYSLDEVAAHADADLVLHGTIRQAQEVRRVSVELVDRCGQILWSDRIDIAEQSGLDAQEKIAAAIMTRLPADTLRALAIVKTA
jgi:TolB-like protein